MVSKSDKRINKCFALSSNSKYKKETEKKEKEAIKFLKAKGYKIIKTELVEKEVL